MRVAVYSDLHLDSWASFGRIDPETGANSRLMDGIKILGEVKEYCVKHKIKYVFCGGDVFHNSKHALADVLTPWVESMIGFAKEGIETIVLRGQHDHLLSDGAVNALAPFRHLPSFHLMDGVEQLVLDNTGVNVISCPNRKDIEQQLEDLIKAEGLVAKGMTNIFLGHFLVKEILEADGVAFDTGCVSYRDLPKGCDLYLLGDYHPHVWLPNKKLLSIGATNQHTFGSHNRPQGGFLDFDLDKMTFKRVETKAPMFVTIRQGEKFPDGHDPKNFYRVFVESKQEEDKIRASLSDEWNVIFPSVKDAGVEDDEVRLDVGIDMDPEDVIRRYCEYLSVDDRYVQKGLEYLS
jgi:DNA repair exonuclease SbcCD nuclease subunit